MSRLISLFRFYVERGAAEHGDKQASSVLTLCMYNQHSCRVDIEVRRHPLVHRLHQVVVQALNLLLVFLHFAVVCLHQSEGPADLRVKLSPPGLIRRKACSWRCRSFGLRNPRQHIGGCGPGFYHSLRRSRRDLVDLHIGPHHRNMGGGGVQSWIETMSS